MIIEEGYIITLGSNKEKNKALKGIRLPNEIVRHFTSNQLNNPAWISIYNKNKELVTKFKRKIIMKTQKINDKKYYYIYLSIPKALQEGLKEYDEKREPLEVELVFEGEN